MNTRRFAHGSLRRGFALPMVIIIVFVLAGALAAGLTMTRTERAIDDSDRADMYAQSNAETGLQRAVADRAGLGLAAGVPPASDSIRVTLSNGFADVIVTRVRPAVGNAPAVYITRVHGFSSASRVAGTPASQYTVSQLGVWQVGTMTTTGAFTSITGMALSDDATIFNGNDMCTPAAPAVPGVSVPASPGVTGGHTGVQSGSTGSAPSTALGATPAAAAAASPVNWPRIIDSTAIKPSLTIPPGTWPTSTQWADTNFVPVIMIKNGPSPYGSSPLTNTEWTLPTNGRGLLLVQGDLGLHNGVTWSGVVLVGGKITSDNSDRIYGAAVSGLNLQLGLPVPPASVGNGMWGFRYNSCSIALAFQNSGVLRPYRSTWSNAFAVY